MSADFAIPGLMPLASPNVETERSMPTTLEPHSLSSSLWQGIQSIGPYTINDTSPPFAAEKISMILSCPSWPCMTRLFDSSGDAEGSIEILDAALWWFCIPEQELPLLPGIWAWEIIVTDSRGETLPIFYGVLPIVT